LEADKLQIIEAGAHTGQLACDILKWVRQDSPEVFERLEYRIIEPSQRRRGWQQLTLSEFANQVKWVESLSDLAATSSPAARGAQTNGVSSILFCNELLDAMPVHRFGWDAKRRAWFEWGVALENHHLVWMKMEPVWEASRMDPSSALKGDHSPPLSQFDLPAQLLEVLPDGFIIEICPAAVAWWRQAAGILGWGKLVAIDYGLSTEELVVPERRGGTLRAYRRHRPSPDLLDDPGLQDLTAHVNFTAIREAGESAGWTTDAFLSQEQFLNTIAAQIWTGRGGSDKWTSERNRQFRTLTDPGMLGRVFRVLVQSRNGNEGPCSEPNAAATG
jgi:SAM-dependent MidA family methyltransferase